MANNHKTLASLFSDTADAIREKQGSFGSKVADNFPAEIRKIVSMADGTNDATAVAVDIVKDKTAYVKGKKVVGTLVPVTQPSEDLDAEMEEQDNLISQIFEAIEIKSEAIENGSGGSGGGGGMETVAGGHMVKFYDEFNEPLDIRSVRDGATVNAPVYKVKYWQGEDGVAVAFPAIITADLIVVAVNSSTASEIYEHYSIDSGTYPYLYITFRKGMKQIVIVFAKAIVNTNQLSDALYADASVTEMLDPENDMATFLNVLYANVTELSARSLETMWDRDYMLTTFDMPNPENYSGKIIRID